MPLTLHALVFVAVLMCTTFSARAQFTWDGDCGILWYECCTQGKDMVNNWSVQGNPSNCPPTPGPNDSASISGVVDSQGFVTSIKSLAQSGVFFCRAQFLSINDGELSTFGTPSKPSILQMLDGSIINILATSAVANGNSCTFDMRNGTVRSIGEGNQVFVNHGTITKSAQPEVNSNISVKIDNQGFITCESGTLHLTGGGTNNGYIAPVHDTTIRLEGLWSDIDGQVAGEGTVWFSGGSYTVTGNFHPKYAVIAFGGGGASVNFDSNSHIPNLRLDNSSILSGSGELTIDHLTWNASPASMVGEGTTIVTQTALLQGLYNNGTCDLERHMEFAASANTVEKPGTSFRLNTAEVRNEGEFEIQGNASIVQMCCTANSNFRNFGMFRKTGGSNSVISVLFSNIDGTVEVQSGVLTFDAQMASTGSMVVNAGAELVFGQGDGQSLFPQGSITGEGTLRFSGGVADQIEGVIDVPTIFIDAAVVIFQIETATDTLNMSGGILDGSGDFIINQALNWAGGFMVGGGVTRVIGDLRMNGGQGFLQRTLVLDQPDPLMSTCSMSPDITGHLTIVESGKLTGSGKVDGNVNHSHGQLSPGTVNSPVGHLCIAGNLGQTWQAVTNIDLAGPTNHDRMTVGGRASIGGAIFISANGAIAGQSFEILTANSVSGSYGPIFAPAGFEIQYTPTSVIVHAPFGPPALVNFDTYPDGSAVQSSETFTDQWASVGVVFSDGAGGGPGPSGNACSISPPNHAASGTGLIVATFVDPCTGEPSATDTVSVQQDWCWAGGEGLDVYAYDASGAEIGHQFVQGGGVAASFKFETQIIRRLDIYPIGQGIDNFSFVTPASVPENCAGDISGDETVNVADLLALITQWGPCGLGVCEPDTNCDRLVNVSDLLAVISAWGPCPSN